MTLGICNDHAGTALAWELKSALEAQGHRIVHYGTAETVSVDYPDYAHALAKGLAMGEVDAGIALCGTGNGMAITLNKYPSIRAGLAWNADVGRLVAAHNNANVLVIPARFVDAGEALSIVRAWLDTPFEGGRHAGRIAKIVPR